MATAKCPLPLLSAYCHGERRCTTTCTGSGERALEKRGTRRLLAQSRGHVEFAREGFLILVLNEKDNSFAIKTRPWRNSARVQGYRKLKTGGLARDLQEIF